MSRFSTDRYEDLISGLAAAITVPMDLEVLASNLARVRQFWSHYVEASPVSSRDAKATVAAGWIAHWRTTSRSRSLLSADVLQSFLRSAKERNLKPSTIERYVLGLVALKNCLGKSDIELAYLARQALTESKRRRDKGGLCILGRSAIERLIEVADPSDPRDVRDLAILLMSYESGTHPMEYAWPIKGAGVRTVQFDVDDLVRSPNGYRLRLRPLWGSEDLIRHVDLSARCSEWIDRWLAISGCTSGPLFPADLTGNTETARLQQTRALQSLRMMAARAGFDPARIGSRSAAKGLAADQNSVRRRRLKTRAGALASNNRAQIRKPAKSSPFRVMEGIACTP